MTWRVMVEEGMGIAIGFETFEIETMPYMYTTQSCSATLTVREEGNNEILA